MKYLISYLDVDGFPGTEEFEASTGKQAVVDFEIEQPDDTFDSIEVVN